MSRNRVSLLRAMHKLTNEPPKQQLIEQQPSKSKTIIGKSYMLAALALLCVGGAYWNYVSVKHTPLGEEQRMALQQNDRKSMQEGMQILKKKYSK